jgi:NAD-dependent deacetylase
MEIPATLITALRRAKKIAVLTGAGISAESGVPTFRDAQTGLWAKYQPEELATPQAFRRDPKLVWEWYAWRRELVSKAKPNAGHLALAQLELLVSSHSGEFTLITQNVDGLHACAGSQNIVELHGNISRIKCFECGRHAETWADDGNVPPRCESCGGQLRPDVVWFGEALPPAALTAAFHAAQNCEIFFSIGTSGLVEPAASLPWEALRARAVVVEINPNATPLSDFATHTFPSVAGEVLPELLAMLRR